MSGIPKDIPGFGNATQRARQNPEFDPTRLSEFTSEDYYVWSRIDGTASLRELILMTGFETKKAISILARLRGFGALLMPSETPASIRSMRQKSASEAANPAPPEPDRRRAPSKLATQKPADESASDTVAVVADDNELDEATLTETERAALAEDIVLSDKQRRRVLSMLRKLRSLDHFSVFGLTSEANKKQIKRAYFRLSKEFHPDRFYGKKLGSFAPWTSTVFERLTHAFEVLSSPSTRNAYMAALRGESPAVRQNKGEQSKQEYAKELFARACGAETSGQLDNAMQIFVAAVRMDPQPKYLRRAATCAVAAGELSKAEEYAKKAADLQRQNPSYARVLADVYRASGKWGEAEKILVHALELKTENDVLTSELHADLAEVRRIQGS